MSEAQPDLGLDPGAAPEAPPADPAVITDPVADPTPAPSWRTGLPAEMADHPSLAKIADVPALAKSFLSSQELIGKKGIIPPGEGASEDEMNAFYTALGRPETVEGYELDDFQPPDGIADLWNAQGMEKMVEKLHARGASKELVRGILEDFAAHQSEMFGDSIGKMQNAEAATAESLKRDWGLQYGANIDLAKRTIGDAAEAVGISRDELAGVLLPDGSMVGNSPVLTKIFALIGKSGAELPFLGEKSRSFTRTPAEAKQEIASLEASEAFTNPRHPEHKGIIDKRAALYEMMYPEETE